jgi:hypothetical protein
MYPISYFNKIAICHLLDGRLARSSSFVRQLCVTTHQQATRHFLPSTMWKYPVANYDLFFIFYVDSSHTFKGWLEPKPPIRRVARTSRVMIENVS